MIAEIAQDGVRATQLIKLLKDCPHGGLDIGVGIQTRLPVPSPDQPNGQHLNQFAFARLVQSAALESGFDRLQLGFAQYGSPFKPNNKRSL